LTSLYKCLDSLLHFYANFQQLSSLNKHFFGVKIFLSQFRLKRQVNYYCYYYSFLTQLRYNKNVGAWSGGRGCTCAWTTPRQPWGHISTAVHGLVPSACVIHSSRGGDRLVRGRADLHTLYQCRARRADPCPQCPRHDDPCARHWPQKHLWSGTDSDGVSRPRRPWRADGRQDATGHLHRPAL
jgi:hypothetical protein